MEAMEAPKDASIFIRGQEYTQIFHSFPALEPFYFNYEKNFNPLPILDYMASINYTIPVTTVIIYLLMCFIGTKYMKDKKPFNMLNQLALWNFVLAVFSIYGTIRVVPHLLYKLSNMTFEESVCEPAETYFGAGAAGFAVQLFILSKIPELFDTLFIILRKKPLIFLHWYHHITVLLYCWNSYVTESGAGIYFVAMNYLVHAVMYTYYFLHAIKKLPKWFKSWIVTTLQISQMIVGIIIVSASLYYYLYGGVKYAPRECNNKLSNVVAGVVIYSSYLYLFLEYAIKRFIFSGRSSIENKKIKLDKVK
jgi:elongation of very long chain fatty acids protein 6